MLDRNRCNEWMEKDRKGSDMGDYHLVEIAQVWIIEP